VAERSDQLEPDEWVLGHGWNQNVWPEGFGSAGDLDEAAPVHPVYLTAKSLHAGWANHAALRLAHLNNDSPDPVGGRLGRDAAGNLTGIVFESAMELLAAVVPSPPLSALVKAQAQAQEQLWRFGLTGVHDFDGQRSFMALQQLHQQDALHLRVVKSLPLEYLSQASALGLHSGFGDDVLRIGSVKLFADGALGPQTAAMIEPYLGQSQGRGMLMLDAEEIFEYGRQAVQSGLSLAIHAIGDRANHEVLQAYQQLRVFERQNALAPLRHRIEHVQLLHPDDLARLGEMKIIASMQPIHATSDMEIANTYWGDRSAYAYAWRSQLTHGAELAFGSDAPVESPNPFWGLHAAVTRQLADGTPGPEGWIPEQRLSLQDALRAYTHGPAYAAGMEDSLGRLTTGYLADLLVLDLDPFSCEPDQIKQIQPLGVMVAGDWVYGGID
jgi:predicted amidohydrolase YtcJ